MVDNLLSTIAALSGPASRLFDSHPYQNKKGVWGHCVRLWSAEHYHMISISDCEVCPDLTTIANCLKRVQCIPNGKDGFYDNKKGSLGYYATFQSELSFDNREHWYMLARSNDYKTLFRMRDLPRVPDEVREMIDYLDREKAERNPNGRVDMWRDR